MRQFSIFLIVTFLLGLKPFSNSYAQEKNWNREIPTLADLESKVIDKLCKVDELVRIELSQERKGGELTVSGLTSGRFAALYFNYYYTYGIKFADTTLSSFKIQIPFNANEEKLQDLKIVQYSADSKGKIVSSKPKNIDIVRRKVGKDSITVELSFQNPSPLSFYYMTYSIQSSNLKDLKPKTIEGNIAERESRLVLEIPDFIQYTTNCYSLEAKLHSVEKTLFFLKTFSIADVGSHSADSFTDTDQRPSKIIKLFINDHTKFYSRVYFNVTSIDIPSNNKYGLDTSKFPTN